MREIQRGKVYRHFKGAYYLVLDIVNDSETNNLATPNKVVIYKALYGDFTTWARPYDMFASEVDHEKYPDVEAQYRFEEVDFDSEMAVDQIEIQESLLNSMAGTFEFELKTKRK